MLQAEFKALRRPFVFKRTDYPDQMVIECERIHKVLEEKFNITLDRKLDRRGIIVDENNKS